ncbi:unnamed protein product [Urochloa humidicola]
MATEDEAREAADGTEVQVEAVDLGTVHFEAHPEVKLPSIMEIKNVGQNIDSAEGMLKIPEDQVLVEAPSEVELPPEHNLNGKASSLNGHMDKEEKISNEQSHDNDQEEAELDGTIAHQSNGIRKEEVTDSLSHEESTTEDNNLLKHEKDEELSSDDQQDLDITVDVNSVQEDTLKTDSAIEQTDDGQQDQNQEPEKGNEDTQPASTANNANVEVLAEAPTVLQTPVEPNLDDSGTVPGTINEKMETEEPDKTDGVVHPDHKESFPEDASIAESAEEVVKVEDQQSQQADIMDEDVVQEDVPKSENADEPATNAHDVLNQESTEETDGTVNEKTEESAHQSNMAAPEEITPENDTIMVELPVNIQVPNQESVEEIEDVEAVDTEAARQQSTVAFEEAIPEEQHNFGITMDSDTVQENTLEAIEQTEDVPRNHDLGQEKATENTPSATIPDVEVVAEAPSEVQTPVATNLDNSDAIPDTVDGNTETDESAKAEDATATSEPHVTETEEEQKDIETTEAQEMTEHGHVIPSKELSAEDDSTADEPHNDDIQQTLGQDLVEAKETVFTSEDNVEDNVTAEEQTCDSQEVDNAESTEETMGNTAENIAEVSDVMIFYSIKEQNVLETGDVAETHMQELEPEETKNTEPVESEEASDQRNVVLFDDLAQEGTPAESEMQQTESATESTETEAQENNVYESEPTADIQPVQEPEPEPEEIKNTELAEVNETSHEMNTTVFQTPVGEDNSATIYLHESAREMSNIEATEVGTPQQSDAAQLEEQAPELIASEPQVPEPESVEEMNGTEATEPPNISQGNLISTSGEFAPEEITTEDKKSIEPDGDHQQEQESTDFMETEADKPQEIALSSTLSASEQSTSEDNEMATEPSSDTQAENADPAEETEGAETVKSNTALAEAAASEEHVETDATVDTSSLQEPELEETNDAEPAGTEDIIASSDLPAENMGMETMGTEAVPRESHVQSIKEPTEDDTEPVLELESVEDTKCTDTMEHPEEPHSSTSDKPTPTEENTTVTESDTHQVQNVISQEIKDSKDAKTDEFSDLSSFPTLEEADQESNLPRTEPTTDVQEEQELGSTEETTDIESAGAEYHQQQGVSALEEPAVDSEPNVDDQQVHEDEVPEVKSNEAMEAEEVIQQSNIDNPHDATEETSELRSDLDSSAQPAQHVELSIDSENNELVTADEPSGQVNAASIEETPTEDSFVSELDPPVDIKQENEHEPMEEIKGIDANEAEEEFHTSQVDATEKPASEGNVAPIEAISDIKQDNELEAAKEINDIEVINDGAQTENATSEGPSPVDNETTPERHPAELTEETMGTETDDLMSVPGIKDEIQTSVELKDGACDLGETVLPTEGSENVTDEATVQSPGNDVVEASNNIDQVKEEQKDGCEHNSSEISGMHNVGNIIDIQDRDISREPLTKRGPEEASQDLFGSDPQGAQDAAKEDDSTEGGEKTSDLSKQPDDVALQLQTCEADALSIGRQDDVVQNVDLDQQQKEDEEIENQKEELQADEQKHEDKGDDFDMEPLVEPEDIENSTKNRTEDTAEAEQTQNVTDEAEKNDIVATDSTNKQDETTDETTNEELEPGLASSGSEPAPSNDDILENDPAAVTQNIESGEHSEDKECTDKVNDHVHTIQASEEEITGEINENREIRSKDNAEQDLSSHQKVEDEKLSMTEQNDVDIEAASDIQEKADVSALYLEKTEREMPSSQKILPTEPEENQISNESNEEELQDENPIPNEKNEENMKDREIGDAEKDVEQDLPVSHFLMNLILGKKNGDADENSEPEAERKQGETTEDNSCVLISKQEESMGSLSTENKVDDDLTFEQEKHDVECPEETQEMVKEQSDDLMLDKERSMHTDEESNKNTHDSEILAYQGNPEDKSSGEVSSEEEAGVSTKMETRDIEISNLELDDKEVNTVCQEKTEASTKIENGSLNSNINDLANTEASEEDTLGEGEAGLLHESLPEDKTVDAWSEKMPLLTESDMVDEKDLSSDVEAVKVLACAKEDATTKPSISATTTTDIQLECEEVDKKEEEQHASTATSKVSREDAEILNDNVQKSSTSSEVTCDEQAPQITEPISDTQKILAHEKEISEGSTCMDVKESSNFSIKGVDNFQTAVKIQADGPNMQVNQDKKDEVADKKTTMEPEKLGKSDFQEHQETATEQKSPKTTDEGDQQLLIKNETMIKEQVVPRTVEGHEQTVSIKSNKEQELFDSKVQERDLDMVSPRELSAAEENFVEVTKPGFSTDEEQSPKADAEEKTYDEKIKDFTDGAATKTEVPGATQKARKKQNLLSGVGSKVKQQLAKVKKAIVRKPGNTKPDSPKS